MYSCSPFAGHYIGYQPFINAFKEFMAVHRRFYCTPFRTILSLEISLLQFHTPFNYSALFDIVQKPIIFLLNKKHTRFIHTDTHAHTQSLTNTARGRKQKC